MQRRSISFILLAVLALGVVSAWVKRDAIAMGIFRRTVERNVTRDLLARLDPDALHIGFCGTGSPVPSRDRGEACTVVIAGGRLFVFDAGEGAARTLSLMGMPLGKIEGVWLTHLHSDHFEGLGNLALQRWAGSSASTPLKVFGPEGVQEVAAGLNMAYRLDSTYRIAHHGAATVPPSGFGLAANAIAPGLVYEKDELRITAIAVDHRPIVPAFGFRIDWKGHSVTLSGDTAPTPNLVAAAKGSDLLVHEVLSTRMVKIIQAEIAKAGFVGRAKIMGDIQGYHTSPEAAATEASQAHVKLLAFSHIVPSVPRFMEGAFMGNAHAHFAGPIWMMRDGDLVSIGAGGKVERENLLR